MGHGTEGESADHLHVRARPAQTVRVGGGKQKGNNWERESARRISLWLTNGEKGDLLTRNVLSGGTFTNAMKAGRMSSHMPGDLMAAHPAAFAFMSRYSIECKHHKDLKIIQYLLDPRQQSELAKIIDLARRQAAHHNLEFMVIARQNRVEPFTFLSESVGYKLLESLKSENVVPMYHRLHQGRVFCLRFTDMLSMVDPNRFLEK